MPTISIVALFNEQLFRLFLAQMHSATSLFRQSTTSLCREVTWQRVLTTLSRANKVNYVPLFNVHNSPSDTLPNFRRYFLVHKCLAAGKTPNISFTSSSLFFAEKCQERFRQKICFQWQTFNGGNWNTLEINVRSFVGRLNRDLIMYTGTWVGRRLYFERCSLMKF